MKTVIALALAGALLQQAPAPVFRSGTELVTVTAIVVDSHGAPVKGLTAGDFTVTLDGGKRAVRALDYLEFGSDSTAADPSRRAPGAAAPVAASRGGRVILLVVDDLSARPGQMTGLRVSAQRMLATLNADDLVGVSSTSGLGPALSPTRDRAAVLSALSSKALVGRRDDTTQPFFVTVPEALDIAESGTHRMAIGNTQDGSVFARVFTRECLTVFVGQGPAKGNRPDDTCDARLLRAAQQLADTNVRRAASQLSAYTQLIDAMRAAPAPRVIIALSSGLAARTDKSKLNEFEPVMLAAAKSGVQFYALTEIADGADPSSVSGDRAAAQRDEDSYMTAGIQTVADAAGGTAFRVAGQADGLLRRIVTETSGMYQLAVDMPPLQPGRTFMNVKIAVNRPGVSIRTNLHALAPSAAAADSKPMTTAEALEARIAQGGAAPAVSLTSGVVRQRAEGILQFGVSVRVPAVTPGPLVLQFALVSDAGAITRRGQQQLAAPIAGDDFWTTFLIPAEGGARLRIAVADAAGHIGAVEHQVTGALDAIDRFFASDLAAVWHASGKAGLSTEAGLPKTTTSVQVQLQLHPKDAAANDGVRVRFSVTPDGALAPVFDRVVLPVVSSALSFSTDVAIADLAPGVYTITATVLDAGKTLGVVSRKFIK